MVFVSIMTLFALGLAASIILAVASRVFYVKEDPRVEAVVEALPGANCGGCGFAGCEGYATAVVNDPSVPANKCCAGGAATSIAVGELTGKTVAEAEPLYALRRCDKLAGKVAPRYQYQGMPSCAAAALMRGGTSIPAWDSATACRSAPSVPWKCVTAWYAWTGASARAAACAWPPARAAFWN